MKINSKNNFCISIRVRHCPISSGDSSQPSYRCLARPWWHIFLARNWQLRSNSEHQIIEMSLRMHSGPVRGIFSKMPPCLGPLWRVTWTSLGSNCLVSVMTSCMRAEPLSPAQLSPVPPPAHIWPPPARQYVNQGGGIYNPKISPFWLIYKGAIFG